MVINPQPYIVFQADFKTVTLRNPVFGNAIKYNFNITNAITRGGSILINPNSQYPFKKRIRELSMDIEYLSELQVNTLIQFLKDTLGKVLSIIDFEGLIWDIIITNPDIAVTQSDRNNRSVSINAQIVE